MFDADRLFVLWSEPSLGSRCVIGELWRDARRGPFGFAYRPGVDELQGFIPLPEFPDTSSSRTPYRSPYLFATFGQRLPSPQRGDYGRLLAEWGVEDHDDIFEILARSGGVQMTDRVELAEYREDDDALTKALEFRVAGMKHAPGSDVVAPGARLDLQREPENAYDESATLVLTAAGHKVGYVPKQYSSLFARLLDKRVPIEATAVRHLTLPADKGQLVVRARAGGTAAE